MTVAVRCVVVALGATLMLTALGPVPLLGVTVTQGALLLAVHPHSLPAVTPTLPVPPVAPNAWLVGDKLYVHDAAA
jgi:hypothetical protein